MSDSEDKAREIWESGNMFHLAAKAYGPGGNGILVSGDGHYAKLVRATVGANREQFVQSMMGKDSRIYLYKRRSRLRDFFAEGVPGVGHANSLAFTELTRIYEAVAFANRCGIVLNFGLSISWFLLADCAIEQANKMFEHFKKLMVQWLNDQGVLPQPLQGQAYIYMHETAAKNRYHTHMLWWVPSGLVDVFGDEVSKALKTVIGSRPWPQPTIFKPGARSDFVRMHARFVPDFSTKQKHPRTNPQWIRVRYLLKGLDPNHVIVPAAKRKDADGETNPPDRVSGDLIDWAYEDPGPTWLGERCRASQALGPDQRAAMVFAGGARFRSVLKWQMKQGCIDVRDVFSDWYLNQAELRETIAFGKVWPDEGADEVALDVIKAVMSLQVHK